MLLWLPFADQEVILINQNAFFKAKPQSSLVYMLL